MAHVVHHDTTPQTVERDSGAGWAVALLIAIIVIAVLYFYGLPALQNDSRDVNVQVPERVDVNVSQPQQ
jgi:hypothetical protein